MFSTLLESLLNYGQLENTEILVYTSTSFMNTILQNYCCPKLIFEINDTYETIDKARLDLFNLKSVVNYEKILYLDTNVIVKGNIKKVFDVIKEDILYVLEEGYINDDSDYWGKTLFSDEINNYTDLTAFTSGILLFNNCEKIKDLFMKIKQDILNRPHPFHDQPHFVYNAFKYKAYNNKALKAYAVNNDYNIHSDKIIHHFPGGPGKIDNMSTFLSGIKNIKNKPKILVSILTSSNAKLCKLTYNSILTQNEHELNYTVEIVVNSLKVDYYMEVEQEFIGINIKIVKTQSNGFPGKGHNSVLKRFQTQSEYDYCMLIDGDDFYLNNAFSRISHYLNYKPDVLFLCFTDNLSLTCVENSPHISIRVKCFLNYNINDITYNLWLTTKGGKSMNPFTNNINKLNTVGRPLLFSRKALSYDVYYDETLELFDDFIVFMKCFEQCLLGNLKVFGVVDSEIYLYNQLYIDRASNRYSQRERENINFQKSIKNKYLTLRLWDLKKLPMLTLDEQFQDENYYRLKIANVDKIVEQLDLEPLKLDKPKHNFALLLNHAKKTNNVGLQNAILNLNLNVS